MPSLLVAVFLLQLAIHIINSVGPSVINETLWPFVARFAPSTAKNAQRQLELRCDVVRLKRELNATSSQDEFAKWAKIKRAHDKAMQQFDEITKMLDSGKSQFNSIATAIRFLSTNGLRLFLLFYYSRQPIYWIPEGWAPYYVEWMLSFPRAPLGSVSIQIWGMACTSAIGLVAGALTGAFGIIMETTKAKEKPEKVFAKKSQ